MSAGASLASERISGEADGASATTEAAGGSTEVAGASGEGAGASIEVAGASREGAGGSTEVAGASEEGAGASIEVAGASGAAGVAGPSAFTSGVAAGGSGAGEDSTTGVSGRSSVTVARSCAPAAPAWAPATTMSSALGAGGGAAIIWPTGRLAQPERRTSISAATATYAPCSRRVMTVCPLVPRVDWSGRRRAACGRVHPSCHLYALRAALQFRAVPAPARNERWRAPRRNRQRADVMAVSRGTPSGVASTPPAPSASGGRAWRRSRG